MKKIGGIGTLLIPIVLLILLTLFLFRGSFSEGLQFDQVYRTNNLIPLLNTNAEPYDQSIFDIEVFGFKIPLMYKVYVSSAGIIQNIFLGLFDNFFIGLRFLKITYFLIPIIISFIFINIWGKEVLNGITSSKKTTYWITFAAALLITTSPILFPEIRTNSSVFHIFYITLFFIFTSKFLANRRAVYLFLSSLFLSYALNEAVYTLWPITAILVTFLLLYPRKLKDVLGSLKNIFAIMAGVIIGAFNYVIYNICTGFPLFWKLFNKIFRPDIYNQNPIDFKESKPLLDEFASKLMIVNNFFNGSKSAFTVLLVVLILLVLIVIILLLKKRKLDEFKAFFFPICVFLFTFLFILVSPNTTRAGHYMYISPFFELSIVLVGYLFIRIFRNVFTQKIISFLVATLILFNLVISNNEVIKINETGGTGYFSPAIFELNHYISDEKIDSGSVVFLEWGFSAQLYFLNRGEFNINSLAFKLMQKNKEAQFEIFRDLFRSIFKGYSQKSMYFPLYTEKYSKVRKNFIEFIESYDEKLEIERIFYEKNGKEAFTLFRLDAPMELSGKIISEEKGGKSVYIPDGGHWISPSSNHFLNCEKWERLYIRGYIPDIKSYTRSDILLEIFVDGERADAIKIDRSDFFEGNISMAHRDEISPTRIDLKLNSKYRTTNEDKRSLGFILNTLECK